LARVREDFNLVDGFAVVKKWGLGLTFLFQGRILMMDPDYLDIVKNNDDRLKIFKLLIMKAKVPLIHSYYQVDTNVDKQKIWFLGYQAFSGYYIARIFSILGQYNDCYNWYSRAKVEYNVPPSEYILNNKDFHPLIANMLVSINNESTQLTKDRINFYNCCTEVEKKMNLVPSNLSESTILKTALSKSTFNMLIESTNNNPLHDIFSFWKPVSESLNSKKKGSIRE